MILNEQIEKKGNQYPSHIINQEKDLDTFYFHTANRVILEVIVLRDSVVRFRYTTTNKFEDDFSYAIDKNPTRGYDSLELKEEDDKYIIETSKIAIHIFKHDLRKTIYCLESGKVVLQDEQGFHWEESYELG